MSRTEADLLDAPEHRRRTSRQVRHAARTALHVAALDGDPDVWADADVICPQGAHDLGRKASLKPPHDPKPGRRPGFKVWKTRYWKRRRALWASRNQAERRVASGE